MKRDLHKRIEQLREELNTLPYAIQDAIEEENAKAFRELIKASTEKGREISQLLDELTRNETAFDSFLELCQDGYSPTLSPHNYRGSGLTNQRRRVLADEFDGWQQRTGTARRAYRGGK